MHKRLKFKHLAPTIELFIKQPHKMTDKSTALNLLYQTIKPELLIRINKCMLIAVLEFIGYSITRYTWPQYSASLYGLYCSLYFLNGLKVPLKMIKFIKNNKLIDAALYIYDTNQIDILYGYLQCVRWSYIIKLLVQCLSLYFTYGWLMVINEWIMPIACLLLMGDMLIHFRKEAKMSVKLANEYFDRGMLARIYGYVGLNVVMLVYSSS